LIKIGGRIKIMSNTYKEKHRPQFHVTHEKGWLNDPNGMVYFNDKWHLYYQLDPNTKYAGHDKWWGHVESEDLVNWKMKPIALSPDEFGSMWSGSAVVDFNNDSGLFTDTAHKQGLLAFYTVSSHEKQAQSLAYSLDEGETWIKYNNGAPIIDVDQDPLGNFHFRDPKVWKHEESGKWMMVVAGGPVRFYSSDNLINWSPEGMHDEIHTECPDFFPLYVNGAPDNKKWVLSGGGVWYMVGDYKIVDGLWRFVPDSNKRYRFNHGLDVYAAQTFSDAPDGRRIKIDWMTNIHYAGNRGLQDATDPWCHALTLPYELELLQNQEGYLITQNPVAELELLREEKCFSISDKIIKLGDDNVLKKLSLDIYEIEAVIDVACGGFGLNLRKGENKYSGKTIAGINILYNTKAELMTLDRSASGLIPFERFASAFNAKVACENGKVKLRIYVDKSSIEVFAQDGKTVFTAVFFPDDECAGLDIFAQSGEITIKKMDIYKLKSIWRS